MFTYERKIKINCGLKEIFEFHLNPANINKISPPGLRAEIISISDNPLKQGSEVKLKVTQFGVPTRWHLEISEYKYPLLVCDEQISGIFNYWKHYHIFEDAGNGVFMTDKVIFLPPFGVIGKVIYPLIYTGLSLMFSYRHRKTKKLLED